MREASRKTAQYFISPVLSPDRFIRFVKGILTGSHQKIPSETDYPPCFEPAVLAGLSCFVERWKNSDQKNTDVFWNVWEPQYQEANNVICSANSPAILEKIARKRSCFLWFLTK